VPRAWLDLAHLARAKRGIPIGAGNLGLVRSTGTRSGPGDTDLDGIPNTLDVDDDGDRILDDYDRASRRLRSAAAPRAAFPDGSFISLGTSLAQPFEPPVNWAVNVNGGSTDADLATVQRANGNLYVIWTGLDEGTGELDCGVLVYCRAGGTGGLLAEQDPFATPRPFPACCDPDQDGLGTLTGVDAGGAGPGSQIFRMSLSHGTTTEQIRPGDVLIEKGSVGGVPQESAATLGFVFATYPVFAGYDDGEGHADRFAYPPSEACRAAPGACAVPVSAGPGGQIALRLSVWRPQRPRVEGEPGSGPWMDVGQLAYAIGLTKPSGGIAYCPRSSYTQTDPALTAMTTAVNLPNFVPNDTVWLDGAGDRPSDAANTFTVTLDVTGCHAALGIPLQRGIPLQLYAVPIHDGQANAFASSSAQFVQTQP
jgi:hypothetical protein